jgi:hypothetical protein
MDQLESPIGSRPTFQRSTSININDLNLDLRSDWIRMLERILDSTFVTVFMTVITVYALFGDDIRMLAFPKSADDVFFGISTACLFFFLLELVTS